MSASIGLGPFNLLNPIGHGAMGEVWSAQHVQSGAQAAVKVITHPDARQPKFQTLFRNEVRAMAAMNHANIVQIYDVGTVPEANAANSQGRLIRESPYLVMEWVPAVPLHLEAGRLPWVTIKQIIVDVLHGLAHAHARDIIHCDLKPQNILFNAGTGRSKLTDYGVAQAFDDSLDLSIHGGVIGTPNYMSPEQLYGHWRQFGAWTDLYGLGCTIYALVS